MTPLVLTRGDIPGVAWPPIHSQRTASLAAQILQLETTQWLPAEAIAQGQAAQLAVLAAHFADVSPAFAARLRAAGLTAGDLAANLEALPPLDRRAAQAAFADRPGHALPAGHALSGHVSTSGSTGTPVVIWKTALGQLDWVALTVRYARWSGTGFGDRLAAIRAGLDVTGPLPDWGRPLSGLFDTGPMLILDIATDTDALIAALQDFEPESLIVYPSTLAAMMTRMGGRRFARLQRVRTVGEQLPPELRTRVGEEWGLPLFDCYSSEEVGYIALQCPGGAGYHSMDETLIVEILDTDGQPVAPGEAGRVVVTDLRNLATPLIRYDIGDIAVRGGPCACGRGLGTISRILGRQRNMIRNPDGTSHWPLTGFRDYRRVAPVIQYQMVQHAPDAIEVRLVTERPLSAAEEDALRAVMWRRLVHPFRLTFSYHEGELPKGPRGKFEEFVSLLPPDGLAPAQGGQMPS